MPTSFDQGFLQVSPTSSERFEGASCIVLLCKLEGPGQLSLNKHTDRTKADRVTAIGKMTRLH